jgi:subtilisin family serine protease
MFLAEFSGKGVRIAVIDSGVHAAHPHVGGVAGGVGIREDGTTTDDYVDRLGHGTAVAAAIREKAPEAEILAIKVFWRTLATDIETLVRAIESAAAQGAHVINLSLGTNEARHRERLRVAVAAAAGRGPIMVAANDDGGTRWFPGSLHGVVGVQANWTCDRHQYAVGFVEDRPVLVTSPYPREIPGVPREKNVNGISFAVANASAFVARALEASPGSDVVNVFATLREAACVVHTA